LSCTSIHPPREGETVIRLLTNRPEEKVEAKQVAQLYRRRWRIEALFQRLESVLNSEITTLGQPRAALLAFDVAILDGSFEDLERGAL
jgi:IS4 transposase